MSSCEGEDIYASPQALTVTLDWKVVNRFPCERVDLLYDNYPTTHQVGAWIGRSCNGDLYTVVGPALFVSTDGGQNWTSRPLPQGEEGRAEATGAVAFTVLHDDRLLLASPSEDSATMGFFASTDRGASWQQISSLPASPFERIGEGFLSLTQLRDGTILFPVWRYSPSVPDKNVQHVFRSTDGGRSWQDPGDDYEPVGSGPQTRCPGIGGTFPGCCETHVLELADGRLLAAFRYSGEPQPWHQEVVVAWGGKSGADTIGRVFKQVFLGDSLDGGKTWQNLRPLLDADNKPVLLFGETHGHLQQLPDGRVILVHDYRYPLDPSESVNIVAHVSEDDGTTWRRERYHLALGIGYPSSLVLPAGTIVTATTATRLDDLGQHAAEPLHAQVIRWRVPT